MIEVLLAVTLWGLGMHLAWESAKEDVLYPEPMRYAFTVLWPAFALVGVIASVVEKITGNKI